jgi:hypothetical protein
MSLVAADYLVLLTTLDAEDYPADRVIALPDVMADSIGVQTAEEPDRRRQVARQGFRPRQGLARRSPDPRGPRLASNQA